MAKKDGARSRQKPERAEYEQTMSTSEAAAYLEGLARSLREGIFAIGDGAQAFKTAIAGDVELEVEARRGKRRSRIDLTLAFRAVDGNEEPTAADQPVATIPDEMSF
jgi:amphi-Trp domain-containing protein